MMSGQFRLRISRRSQGKARQGKFQLFAVVAKLSVCYQETHSQRNWCDEMRCDGCERQRIMTSQSLPSESQRGSERYNSGKHIVHCSARAVLSGPRWSNGPFASGYVNQQRAACGVWLRTFERVCVLLLPHWASVSVLVHVRQEIAPPRGPFFPLQ